jgi:hypothetical protein
VEACHKRANRLEQINLAKERIRQRSNNPRGGGANRSLGRQTTPAPSREATPGGSGANTSNDTGWLDAAARVALMKDGKSFK